MSDQGIDVIVSRYIHEGKQFADDKSSAVLTVARVGRPQDRGALDVGGSEYAETNVVWIEPNKERPDDKHGWWRLAGGSYVVEFNERLSVSEYGGGVLLHVWAPALRAGVSHPSELITVDRDPVRTIVTVGSQGLAIKENARLSQVSLLG